MIAPTNTCEIKAVTILLAIIGIIVSLRGIQTFQQDILDVLTVNVRKQKIQTSSSIGFAVFMILASNGASLIQISTIWTSQDLLLAWNRGQKSYFLLKNERPLQIKTAIVNGQLL